MLINFDVFAIYCCLELVSNFALKSSHKFDVIFRKFNYTKFN